MLIRHTFFHLQEQYKSIFEALLAYMKHTQILLLRRVIAISSCNTIVVLVFSSLHDVDLLLRSCSQLPMRMRVKGGVDEGGWTNTESKMESRRVAEEREWDQLRLRDVRSDRATYGKPISCNLFIRGITFSFIHNKVEPHSYIRSCWP